MRYILAFALALLLAGAALAETGTWASKPDGTGSCLTDDLGNFRMRPGLSCFLVISGSTTDQSPEIDTSACSGTSVSVSPGATGSVMPQYQAGDALWGDWLEAALTAGKGRDDLRGFSNHRADMVGFVGTYQISCH